MKQTFYIAAIGVFAGALVVIGVLLSHECRPGELTMRIGQTPIFAGCF